MGNCFPEAFLFFWECLFAKNEGLRSSAQFEQEVSHKNILWCFRAAVLGGTVELRYDPGY